MSTLSVARANTSSPVMRTPRSVEIDLTARCNLRCTYCYFFDNPVVTYRDLSSEAWLQFFEECGRLGVMSLTLAGGEPFIRPDLPALLQGIVANRMRYSLLSNGTLIDDAIASFIASTRRCDYVQISLDGSRPETHDACRGPGSFAQAVRGLRTLQRHDVPVTVRLTIHQHNVHHLEATARFLLDDLGLPRFSTNAAGYLGACRGNAGQVLLSVAQRQEAMATLLRLSDRYPARITASAGPLSEGRIWREMEAARACGSPPFPYGGRLTGCGCPSHKIAVRADGAIVPCTLLAHIVLGRITHDPLDLIWRESEALNALRQRHEIPLSDFAFCAGCAYQPFCTGNCPGLAYTLTGQVNHPSPDACLRRYLDEGGQLPSRDPAMPGAAPVEVLP